MAGTVSTDFITSFRNCGLKDIALVGGKNASLGEMIGSLGSKGVSGPGGFAVNVNACWEFIHVNELKEKISKQLDRLDRKKYSNLPEIGSAIRSLLGNADLPLNISECIIAAYQEMEKEYGEACDVAVRSSATAEDLPGASFAGQHESFLNICGSAGLLKAVHRCFISLYTDRAIKYREDKGFDHMKVALSVGVQKMVRSDLASSGVMFTLDPETGSRDAVFITGNWGLGESIVQGIVDPDEFIVFKTKFREGKKAIIQKKTGRKQKKIIYTQGLDHQPQANIATLDTAEAERIMQVLNDAEIDLLAKWAIVIEEHYKQPMDIEWAKDGTNGELYIVQARPETVHQSKDPYVMSEYSLGEKGEVITKGNAIGEKIVSGTARVLHSPSESHKLLDGEILITDSTNPDWDPIMKRAGGIVTDRGGRTSHASIIARELELPAIVGTGDATAKIRDGEKITLSCAGGKTGIV
jgi:pyruvate,water dikinase